MMPPKRCGTPRWATTMGAVAASGSRAKCDLCLANIVEGKDEVLQCEGAYQQWFHRYCAGVSQSHFKTLTTSDSPFVCLYCSRDLRQAALNQLQDEALKTEVGELLAACDLEVVRGIASKSDLLTALSEEVQQLKVQCESA